MGLNEAHRFSWCGKTWNQHEGHLGRWMVGWMDVKDGHFCWQKKWCQGKRAGKFPAPHHLRVFFLLLIQVALGIPVPRNWCELPGVQIGEFCWTPPPSTKLSYNFRSPLQKNLWNGLNSQFFFGSKCHLDLKEMIPAIFPPFLTCIIYIYN